MAGNKYLKAIDLEDPGIEQADLVLKKGEKGFEIWLRAKDEKELEVIVNKLNLRASHAVDEYLNFVKDHETLAVCSKCEFKTGCVACDYRKALAYVVRHQTIPFFWAKKHGMAFKKQQKKNKKGIS